MLKHTGGGQNDGKGTGEPNEDDGVDHEKLDEQFEDVDRHEDVEADAGQPAQHQAHLHPGQE